MKRGGGPTSNLRFAARRSASASVAATIELEVDTGLGGAAAGGSTGAGGGSSAACTAKSFAASFSSVQRSSRPAISRRAMTMAFCVVSEGARPTAASSDARASATEEQFALAASTSASPASCAQAGYATSAKPAADKTKVRNRRSNGRPSAIRHSPARDAVFKAIPPPAGEIGVSAANPRKSAQERGYGPLAAPAL